MYNNACHNPWCSIQDDYRVDEKVDRYLMHGKKINQSFMVLSGSLFIKAKSMELQSEIVNELAEVLKERGETIAVAESTTGGLISARLLAVPGASAYFLGGTVIYTGSSRKVFLGATAQDLSGVKPMTEEMAMFFAQKVRQMLSATWGVAELGIAGPSGSAYGVDAGSSVIAVSGPVETGLVVKTGQSDRAENMEAFADSACQLIRDALSG